MRSVLRRDQRAIGMRIAWHQGQARSFPGVCRGAGCLDEVSKQNPGSLVACRAYQRMMRGSMAGRSVWCTNLKTDRRACEQTETRGQAPLDQSSRGPARRVSFLDLTRSRRSRFLDGRGQRTPAGRWIWWQRLWTRPIRQGARNVICWRPDSPHLTDSIFGSDSLVSGNDRANRRVSFGTHRRRVEGLSLMGRHVP